MTPSACAVNARGWSVSTLGVSDGSRAFVRCMASRCRGSGSRSAGSLASLAAHRRRSGNSAVPSARDRPVVATVRGDRGADGRSQARQRSRHHRTGQPVSRRGKGAASGHLGRCRPSFGAAIGRRDLSPQVPATRRQPASFVRLAPSPYASGDVSRDRGIGKAGTKLGRQTLVELAWSWLRYHVKSLPTATPFSRPIAGSLPFETVDLE
jgi:hypothetical protein